MLKMVTMLLAGVVMMGAVQSADISDIRITPQFETAGIILASTASVKKLEIRKLPDGAFTEAHPFVRFDAQHLASSLFDLTPGCNYEVRIERSLTKKFTARKNFELPKPLTTLRLLPGASVQAALKQAKPGTAIVLAPGTYSGAVTITGLSGTAEAPIVLCGQVDRKLPVSQRTLPVIDAGGSDIGIYLEGCNHVVIDSLKVMHTRSVGVRFTRSTWCAIINSQIYDSGHDGILISKGGNKQHHLLIQDNHIADLQHDPFAFSSKGNASVTYYGIKRDNNPGWGTVIRGNLIEGFSDGIASGGDESKAPSVAEDAPNVLASWPNYELDCYDNVIKDCRDDGIETDGIVVNHRFFRNRITHTQNGFSIAPVLPGPIFFVRNVIDGPHEASVKFNTSKGRGTIRNCFFYHNTFVRYSDAKSGAGTVLNLWDGTPSKDIVFRNNIFAGTASLVHIQRNRDHKPDMDYNLWFSSLSTAFVWEGHWKKSFKDGWAGTLGCDPHGRWGNPALDENFKPAERSPAIDGAVRLPGINDTCKGRAPDIGAIEE